MSSSQAPARSVAVPDNVGEATRKRIHGVYHGLPKIPRGYDDCGGHAFQYGSFHPMCWSPHGVRNGVTVIQHIFQLHGLPEHVITDCRVQFMAQFWQALLGGTGVPFVTEPSGDRWRNRMNECSAGAIPVLLCELPTGKLGGFSGCSKICVQQYTACIHVNVPIHGQIWISPTSVPFGTIGLFSTSCQKLPTGTQGSALGVTGPAEQC